MRRISYIPLLFFPIILSIECNSQNLTLPVWPDGIPGSIRSETYFEESEVKGDIVSIYEKVTNPSLTVFLPPADKATGIAVLICPGGGYRALAFDYEGTDIARWLNANERQIGGSSSGCTGVNEDHPSQLLIVEH